MGLKWREDDRPLVEITRTVGMAAAIGICFVATLCGLSAILAAIVARFTGA